MPIENAPKSKNPIERDKKAVDKKDSKNSKNVSNKTTEDAPPPRGEQAP